MYKLDIQLEFVDHLIGMAIGLHEIMGLAYTLKVGETVRLSLAYTLNTCMGLAYTVFYLSCTLGDSCC